MPNLQTQPEEEKVISDLISCNGLTEKQARFVTAIAACGWNVSEAERQTGISRRVHYYGLNNVPAYKEAYQHTLTEIGNEALLALARKAIIGDIVFDKNGEPRRDPETGEYIRSTDTVAGIFVAKSTGRYTDQTPAEKNNASAGPSINIYLPEQNKPTIEVNEAEDSE